MNDVDIVAVKSVCEKIGTSWNELYVNNDVIAMRDNVEPKLRKLFFKSSLK